MKRLAILSIFAFSVAAVAAVVYDQGNFSAGGRMYQPAPQGHIPGADNEPGGGVHHSGEECARCHRLGGRAEQHLFTMSGTLYSDRSARRALAGGEIIMQDRDGNVVSMTSNEAGNFWTTSPLASNPYTVVSHGGPPTPLYTLDEQGNLVQAADPGDLRTWLYKTWVRKGQSVRPMVTVAPVGSASNTKTHMSCNMHHAGMGSRGGLWVSPGPTLPGYPSKNLSYRKHIYPILRSKCSPCHIPGSTMTRIVTKSDLDTPSTSIDYSAALDLMTYEGSTVNGIVKKGIGTVGAGSVVDMGNSEQSLLLRKTVGLEPHGGGVFWNRRSQDYVAVKQWIAEGALKN